MMQDPSKYDLMVSIASRKKDIEDIGLAILQLEVKVKQLNTRREELKSLNFLDNILLKEINNGTN